MAKYSAMQIAHWFIKRNQEAMENEGADPMTLLKLFKMQSEREILTKRCLRLLPIDIICCSRKI